MKVVYIRMKKTFREIVMQKCTAVAKKNKLLKYPSMAVMLLILSLYYLCRHFATNGKRYAGIAFSLLFFVSSCSFAVFTGQSGVIEAQEAYSEVAEYSDIGFAVEKEVEPDDGMLPETEEGLKEHELSEDEEDAESYTLDDILGDTDSYDLEDEHDGNASEDSNEAVTGTDSETGTELENGDAAESNNDDTEGMEAGSENGGAEGTETESDPDEVPVFDSSDWRLVLVNKQHPIPEDYSFELGAIKGDMKCDERIVSDLLSMLQAARQDGVNLAVRSPYRTLDRQEYLFDRKINRYMGQGYSYMEAYKAASQIVTIPGSSEHQIGLALDITSDTHVGLDEAFGDTEAGRWLAEHSCEYGFTLRYPDGKEYITGIEYEPWHFRYVGKEAATIMMKDNICLEEFWDKYL